MSDWADKERHGVAVKATEGRKILQGACCEKASGRKEG